MPDTDYLPGGARFRELRERVGERARALSVRRRRRRQLTTAGGLAALAGGCVSLALLVPPAPPSPPVSPAGQSTTSVVATTSTIGQQAVVPVATAEAKLYGLVTVTVVQGAGAAPVGTVLSQDPAGGTVVPQGSQVRLVVVAHATHLVVPNVVGTPTKSASTVLQAVGLHPSVESVCPTSGERRNVVLHQSPAPGTTAPAGATVVIDVALPGPACK
jgi:hypothetical protein